MRNKKKVQNLGSRKKIRTMKFTPTRNAHAEKKGVTILQGRGETPTKS